MLDRPMHHEQFAWTDEAVAELRKLWAEGLSASEVAARMGIRSRSSVIGKVHRLKLPARAKDRSRRAPPASAPRKPHANRGRPKANAIVHRAISRPPAFKIEPLPEDEGVDVTHLVGILDLGVGICKFPVGDPKRPDFGFCGKPVATEGRVYCDHHHERAHYRPV